MDTTPLADYLSDLKRHPLLSQRGRAKVRTRRA